MSILCFLPALLLAGGCSIVKPNRSVFWSLINLNRIITGDLGPKNGSY